MNWLSRFAFVVMASAAMLLSIGIIVLRYWLFPQIEQYHDRIATSLSVAIGNPVTIGKIKGDWQGFLPYLNISDLRILDDQGQPALVLQHLNGSLSWMSLFTAKVRLASLEIDSPELLLHRDALGRFFIGNLAISKNGQKNDFADWMLNQSNIMVRNARIVWIDELRGAPPLVLQHVNLRIDRLFSKHRFALRALPPSEISTPLDVRGEFYGDSFDDVGTWNGQLFTQLDYTDVTAWRPWLDLPSQFSRGRGALRGWLGVTGGRVTQVTADLDLRDVVTRLADDVPEMSMQKVQGRATWVDILSGGFEVSTRHLMMRLQNGLEFQPTDFFFRTLYANDKQRPGGEIRVNYLKLESLVQFTKYLPMQSDMRARLEAYEPRGTLSNLDAQWQGTPEKPDNYRIKGHFANLAVKQVGKMPGFSRLTLDLDGSDTGGRFSINSRGLAVDAPGVMREPLLFTTFIGQGGWQQEGQELSIDVDNIAVANEDLAGNLFGSYRTRAGTLGMLDLTGKLTRGNIRRAARYTPLIALDKPGNDWLDGALQAGTTGDFRIRIKGNLSDFPLDGTKDVLFEIGGHAQNAVMEFDKNWPRIENITGEFLIHGNRLEVDSPSATILDTKLHNVRVALPDMMSKDLALEINGQASGASKSFLEFIQKSPVRGYIDGFTDGISSSGNGHLDLSARIPLSGSKPVEVSGTYKVQDNNINLGEGVPLLRNTRGTLSFTESGMHTNSVSADILGGPASINVQTVEGGAVHATLKGRSNVDMLRKEGSYPLLNYLHGSTAWDADIRVEKKSAVITINSNLQGIGSSLPQPFSKRAGEVMALRVEKNPVMILPKRAVPSKSCPAPCTKIEPIAVVGQDVINARLGNIFSARLSRREKDGVMSVRSGIVNFSADDKLLESKWAKKILQGKSGVWLAGSLPLLSLQGWEGLTSGTAAESAEKPSAGQAEEAGHPAGKRPPLPIGGANLNIEKLTGYGLSINSLHIDASRRGDGLAAKLSSSALNGEVIWEPRGYETGNLIRARISNLQAMSEEQSQQDVEPDKQALPVRTESTDYEPLSPMNPGNLPALDISIENLQLKGKQIGHFELVGHPVGTDWHMRRLNITNPDGSLVGDGVWSDGGQLKSQFNLALDISDAGMILGRSGYPNTVKGGSGRLSAKLSWAGSPDEFNYATLNGTLKLDAGKGQFLKMDPGAGKLLSILSMQALPKHLTTLDFNDVFSKGFQFDNIIGEAAIHDGVMQTQEFHVYGSAAKVALKGNVDLNHETQNLNVKVFPAIGDSMALLAVFAINPAAGIAGLIASTLLDNPLDKLVSYEYNVSGTWSDPKVVKVAGTAANAKPDKQGTQSE